MLTFSVHSVDSVQEQSCWTRFFGEFSDPQTVSVDESPLHPRRKQLVSASPGDPWTDRHESVFADEKRCLGSVGFQQSRWDSE